MVRRSAGLFVAVLYCLSARTASTAALTRGPYLQSCGTNQIAIRWRTDVAAAGAVRYGANLGALDSVIIDSYIKTEHLLVLTNLLPRTRYYYSIENEGQTLAGGENFFFNTAPMTNKPTRVWVLGDSGTRTPDQLAVRDAYLNFTQGRDTDLWLMLGDNAYPLGVDSLYQEAVFDTYPGLLRNSALWPAIGNHDVAYTDASKTDFPFLHIFTLPAHGECGGVGSESPRFYSFDHGNIHFICLDSETSLRRPPSPMLDWLERDLRANTKLWTIAYWHSPPYSRGGHDSDLNEEQSEMRENAVPILENFGVDLVLCGHSHAYERSYLMDSNYGLSSTYNSSMRLNGGDGRVEGNGPYYKPAGMAHKGTVYVVAGSSGQIDGAGTLDHPAMFLSLSTLGSVILDVNGGTLDAHFLTSLGEIADHFTIIKGDDVKNLAAHITSLTNGIITVTWPSLPGHVYTVLFNPHLSDSGWVPVSEPSNATGETSSWTGPLPAGAQNGFFRVALQVD
jgi:hypothetical protein